MDLLAKLAELGLELPEAPKPVAAYIPAVRTGNLVVVSGQLPTQGGRLVTIGSVPGVVSIEKAQEAARQCVLNALAVVGGEIGGDWSRLVRIVRIGVFIASEDEFTEQPRVANGASELLYKLLGPVGQHARVAVGVNTLPLGATVELELMAEVR
ncbi:MAG: RidA family protein [Phycisphaeraceae bacterium]|nr:RidA family protein [Phycisphaeraceae bacterium]